MPKPVCVKCERFMRPLKNGFFLTEGKPTGGTLAPPGLAAPERWVPYKVWVGDKWGCPDCGTEVVLGFAATPVIDDYMDGFDRVRRATGADQLLVKDC